jgi:phosphatidylinositol 4-kinase A
MRGSLNELSTQIVEHSLPKSMSAELQKLLVTACHRISKVRDIAAKYLYRLITSFPSLMCDAPLVCAILEVLTLVRRACEGEFTDEVSETLERKLADSMPSITPSTSSNLRDPILLLSSRDLMLSRMRFWRNSTETQIIGSGLLSAALL